jgi:hypothetical protein
MLMLWHLFAERVREEQGNRKGGTAHRSEEIPGGQGRGGRTTELGICTSQIPSFVDCTTRSFIWQLRRASCRLRMYLASGQVAASDQIKLPCQAFLFSVSDCAVSQHAAVLL